MKEESITQVQLGHLSAADYIRTNYSCNETASTNKAPTMILDIESLAQHPERGSGSPKMKRALSRKWSYRAERCTSTEDEDLEESSKKHLVKVNSQLEPLKQLLNTTKALSASTSHGSPNLMETPDGRNKRLNRFLSINPRKILCFFATVSSLGTLVLIFFTLAIKRRM